ncbi:hypothetical protein ASE75_04835 [Sphingomonas sp. Leaf17]|nr:hypothetical protein ASE75_04835 [Sphingomonas sp. Leaf17]
MRKGRDRAIERFGDTERLAIDGNERNEAATEQSGLGVGTPFGYRVSHAQTAQQFQAVGRQGAAVGHDLQFDPKAPRFQLPQRAAKAAQVAQADLEMWIVAHAEPGDADHPLLARAYQLVFDGIGQGRFVEAGERIVHLDDGGRWRFLLQHVRHARRRAQEEIQQRGDRTKPLALNDETAVVMLAEIIVEQVGTDQSPCRTQFMGQDDRSGVGYLAEKIDVVVAKFRQPDFVDQAQDQFGAMALQRRGNPSVADSHTGLFEIFL